jgi:hypothetical protein
MRQHTFYGSALIGGSLLLIAMGLTHPTGARLFTTREALEQFTLIDHVAHGLAIAGVCLAAVGLAGFSRFLGTTRPTVAAALVTFAMTASAMLVAPALDGFVVPQLANRWFDADAQTQAMLRQLVIFCVSIAGVLTRLYMTLGAIAILLWSFAAWRLSVSRVLPWLGAFVAIAGFATTFGGPPMVSVHELLALALGQALWMVWAGVSMLRSDAPAAGAS